MVAERGADRGRVDRALLDQDLGTQARVLFGGSSFLRDTAGLTVATYAREGFFQLVVAEGVVLGRLIIAEWMLDPDDAAGRRGYRGAGSVLLTLVSAVLAGVDIGRGDSRRWLHTLGYAAILSATVYVSIDIEFPRLGFIRIDAIDQVLVDLRASLK